MNPNATRYWTWTTRELEDYFGIRQGGRSYFLDGRDFQPEILGVVQPKQLVDTQTHPGTWVPVRMGEDGKRLLSRGVEKMIGGIPHYVMKQAVEHIEQLRPEISRTLYRVMKRMPFETNEIIADRLGLENVSALYKRLSRAMWAVSRYLDCVAERWPEGSSVFDDDQQILA